jgi:succinoglycan biosynthesis transport protein ExoP
MNEWKQQGTIADDATFSLSDVFEIVYRRKIVVFSVLAITLLATIYLALKPRKYEAEGTLRIQPGSSGRYSTSPITAISGGGGDKIASETAILQSRTVYLRVARELNLVNEPAFWGVRKIKPQSIDDPKTRDLLLTRMARAVKVDHSPKDEIVRISATTISPDLSAKVVNTLINDYIENLFKMKFGATQRASNWIIGQLDDLKQQIETDQKTLTRLQGKLGFIGVDEKNTNYLPAEELNEITKASSDATIQRIVAEARYRFLSETNPNLIEGEQQLLSGSSSSQGLLQSLRDAQAKAAADYARLSAQFGPNYPEVKQAKAELASDTAQVKAEQDRIVNQAKVAYSAAKANEDMTLGVIAQKRSEAARSQDDVVKYTILLHDYESHRSLYEGLVQRLREAGITSGLESGEIDIVDIADPPFFAVAPGPVLIIVGGILAGFLFGCFVALVVELFDTKVSTSEQAEKLVHMPLVGKIPKLALNEQRGSLQGHRPEILDDPRSRYAESLQTLRSSLLMLQSGTVFRVILVTSALPGEGKSITSRNLATTFSQHSGKTLLIDCDMRRGRVAGALGLANKVGLSDVLSQGVAFENAVVPCPGVDGLDVVPAGKYPPQAAILVSSQAMQDLILRCRDLYNTVILDCPPMIGISDALILSSLADVLLLVVREEFSYKKALRDAVGQLTSVRNLPMGFVMNDVNSDLHGYGYGRYYHAYYEAAGTRSKA